MSLKIAIIGAGSTYTPELMEGILSRYTSLPVTHLSLMDIEPNKLNIIGDLCKRMTQKLNYPIQISLTNNLDDALVNATFVLCQIRVGQLPARIQDEQIPLKYNLIGQETTGIGGFFKALRTIPVMLTITKKMEALCPDAFLINFTNPSGIVAQALQTYSKIRTIGLCNVPINMISDIKSGLGITDGYIEYVGLNHLSFITKIMKDDQDLLSVAIQDGISLEGMKNIPTQGFSKELISSIGAIPSSYLEYFYYRNDKLKHLLEEEQCRGEVCMDIENQLLERYQDAALDIKPEELSKRGGARYSEAAISLVDAIYNDKQETHIINIANQGALSFMKDHETVEIAAIVGKDGATPIPIPDFNNQHIIELMQTVKAYENHTIEAAVHGDDQESLKALLIHPLIGDYHLAIQCYEEMKLAHSTYLPQFKIKE